jgi:Leucine-rich repeat (LRR) protein
MYRRIIPLLIIFSFTVNILSAQKKENDEENNGQLSANQIESYKEQCKSMVNFLVGTFNFLGDSSQVMSEKEIIINESYSKIFKNSQVQIEDDLVPNRIVPLRKNVQAYLQDIIFFYKYVNFKYDITSIDIITSENSEIIFKITANRNLYGITINSDTINNNLTRYIEINLDPYTQILRIASIYTTIPDETKEIHYWWNTLSKSWKDYFGSKIVVFDTLQMNLIEKIKDSTIYVNTIKDSITFDSLFVKENDTIYMDTIPNNDTSYRLVVLKDTLRLNVIDSITVDISSINFLLKSLLKLKEVDISNNIDIDTLGPLSKLNQLETLYCSNTSISDLKPIRNLSKLNQLDFSRNNIDNIEPLQFLFTLDELNMSNTNIDSINIISGLTSLEKLTMDSLAITDISPLLPLENLKFLSLAFTQITDITPIGKLSSLKRLILKGTPITDLTPLKDAPSLEYINIDNTNVSDLSPLAKIKTLKTIRANSSAIKDFDNLGVSQELKFIYCDNTGITRDQALNFMDKHPETLVIYDSKTLLKWWNNLSQMWRDILSSDYNISDNISKEQLQLIVNIKNISLANNKEITDLTPLKMLYRLESLDISNTNISDITPLASLNNLSDLNISNTPVSSLDALKNSTSLKIINLNNTQVNNLIPLINNKSLKKVFCDNTNVKKENVIEFKSHIPECLVVYQTEILKFWWNNLYEEWRKEFAAQPDVDILYDEQPSPEQLQQLVDLKKIKIKKNQKLNDLEPLTIFYLLKELMINSTAISDLTPLSVIDSIKILNLSDNPIYDISPLSKLTNIEELYLENTSIEDLTPLENLTKLKVLDVAGTKIRNLKPISKLLNIEKLMLNNTNINNLKFVENLTNLKTLKCFNTNLKEKKVDKFRKEHPDIEVVFY